MEQTTKLTEAQLDAWFARNKWTYENKPTHHQIIQWLLAHGWKKVSTHESREVYAKGQDNLYHRCMWEVTVPTDEEKPAYDKGRVNAIWSISSAEGRSTDAIVREMQEIE